MQAVKNLHNNFGVHLIGMGTTTVSLVIFGIFLLVFVNVNSWVKGLGGSGTMSVFLEDQAGDDQLLSIREAIESIKGAEIVRYISKEDALKDMKRFLGPHEELINALDSNPFPASFEVVFEGKTSPPDFDAVRSMLESIEKVESVQLTEQWISSVKGLLAVVKVAGIGIGSLLGLGVLMIVTNTMRLTIYSRKDEIEILKMVGATDAFVKAPFFLEGLLHGSAAGGAALAVLFAGYKVFSLKKEDILGLGILSFDFIPPGYTVALGAAGVFLGLFGSFIALWRFFRQYERGERL
ncbi:MAG: permease-like cell division protein FtsX [Desulfatiglandaceae bacterium]